MSHRWLPLLLALPALWGFAPFTPVRNVCPKCQTAPSDLLVLTTGGSVRCKVLAQNDDFYVVSRFGELRAIKKREVASIKWQQKGALGTGDQVVLKNGVLLHGSVVEEQAGRLLVIQVGDARHVVWFSQMQSLYKQGKAQTLGSP